MKVFADSCWVVDAVFRWRIYEALCAFYDQKIPCSSRKISTTTFTLFPYSLVERNHLFLSWTLTLHPPHRLPPSPTCQSHRHVTPSTPNPNSSTVTLQPSSPVLESWTFLDRVRKQDGRVGKIAQSSRFGHGRSRRRGWKREWKDCQNGREHLDRRGRRSSLE